jgi:tRNA (mo5U34)-methyltransferase
MHRIDLGDGIVTPGRWSRHPLILEAFDRIDFRGKTVLDIGCWDGLWSFEAEKRGAAEVYATDLTSQRTNAGQPTFLLAHEALRSNVKYHPSVSVFDIATLGVQDFDIVLFCGVYYHLRCPLRALACLRSVMRDGGLLVIEGDAIFGTTESIARFHYHDWHFGDPSNWWIPSIPCLRQWVESSFFDVVSEHHSPRELSSWQSIKELGRRMLRRQCLYVSRFAIVARAVRRKDANYLFPDDMLAAFDLNDYA